MIDTRYQVVALDLDGTVLDSEKRVSAALKRAVARLADGGVRTVLCTGRRWRTALPVVEELGAAHPVVVCAGGALVKEVGSGRTLHAAPLRIDLAREATTAFRRAGLVPFLLYDRPVEEVELLVSELDRQRLAGMVYYRRNQAAFDYHPGEEFQCDEAPLEVYTVDHESRVRPAEAAVRAQMADRALVTRLVQVAYGPEQHGLEVHALEATKWTALSRLLADWSVPSERVVAMGDDVNDIPMLRGAGLSFAMGNALPQVKAAADRVTASHDDDGVVRALRSVFAILRDS